MAQVVKLEPGDILVLANVGDIALHPEGLTELKKMLELGGVVVFPGPVDLAALPAGWTADAVAGG